MIIKRAPHLGAHVQLRQLANNWLAGDLLDGPDAGKPVILNPAAVELEPDDIAFLVRSRDFNPERAGMFWKNWRIDEGTRRLARTGAEPLHSPRRSRTPKHWGRGGR